MCRMALGYYIGWLLGYEKLPTAWPFWSVISPAPVLELDTGAESTAKILVSVLVLDSV